MLDVFLPLDRRHRCGMLLIVGQHFDSVLFGESLHEALAMLIHAADEIAGDADIERPARAARQDVDPIAFHTARQYGLPGQARQ